MTVPSAAPPVASGLRRLTAREAAAAMDGQLLSGDAGALVGRFSIDSRSLTPGALFFAIRGERFDGHDFVGPALAAGAAGVVVSEPAGVDAPILIRVEDTTRALQALARHIRRLSQAKVVAITGSAGKTTTKEVAAALLSARFRVFRSAGNLNNHIGLPLSLLELLDPPDVAVVELGMNHAGEIRTLVRIAEPDVRVWTNVAEVHTAFFGSLAEVAEAKAEILEGATSADLLVVNADDPLVMARVPGFPGRVVTFGLEAEASVKAVDLDDRGLDGTGGTLVTPAGTARFRLRLIGRPNVVNALAGAAVGWAFGVDPPAMAARLGEVRPAAHRGVVVPLVGGIALVDDSYNSNPRALRAMLSLVGAVGGRRRVGVLGEMLELGGSSIEWHEACGRDAAAALDVLVTVGGEAAEALAREAARRMAPGAVGWVATSVDAAERVSALVQPGDVVLVKGSRGIRTDLVVERLLADRRQRANQACRES